MRYLLLVSLPQAGSGESSGDADGVVQMLGSTRFTKEPMPWAGSWETSLTNRDLDRCLRLLRSTVRNGLPLSLFFAQKTLSLLELEHDQPAKTSITSYQSPFWGAAGGSTGVSACPLPCVRARAGLRLWMGTTGQDRPPKSCWEGTVTCRGR